MHKQVLRLYFLTLKWIKSGKNRRELNYSKIFSKLQAYIILLQMKFTLLCKEFQDTDFCRKQNTSGYLARFITSHLVLILQDISQAIQEFCQSCPFTETYVFLALCAICLWLTQRKQGNVAREGKHLECNKKFSFKVTHLCKFDFLFISVVP